MGKRNIGVYFAGSLVKLEERVFVVPLNETAEQVLMVFCDRNTIPKLSSRWDYTAAALRGDHEEIIKKLKDNSHSSFPSISNLETQILQTKVESESDRDSEELKNKPDLLKKVSKLLAPVKKEVVQIKKYATETKEKLAQINPKEVAQELLDEAKNKLVEQLKVLRIETDKVLFPFGAVFLINLIIIASLADLGTEFKLAGEMAGTNGHLIENIKAYYQLVSSWDEKAFYYLPIILGIAAPLSLTSLGFGFKIKKIENE